MKNKNNIKRILVTAGGTATAWHICNVVNEHFNEDIKVIVADINNPELVPCTVLAEKVIQVPFSNDPMYEKSIDKIIKDEKIDVIIPLIPQEALLFHPDAEIVKKNNIVTTIPPLKTIEMLADKKALFEFLSELDIPTPDLYSIDEIENKNLYIIKPRLGFGSIGVEVLPGQEIKKKHARKDFESYVIQEYCKADDYDEITIEIFNDCDRLEMFARCREDIKSGVCVKMKPYTVKPFEEFIKRIVDNIECPKAFNLQFLRDNGVWKLFDFNLRLPAGTALSTAIGFQLTRALLASVIGKPVVDEYFRVDKSVRHVLRTYQEHVIR